MRWDFFAFWSRKWRKEVRFCYLSYKLLLFLLDFVIYSVQLFVQFQSGASSPNHYHDIESLTLTLGKSRPGRKTSKEKRQSSIWTEHLEVEKERTTTANTGTNAKKSSKPSKASTLNPKSNNKKGEKSARASNTSHQTPAPATFLENPLLLQTSKNWTLPRVELWCRDPECMYNQRLWGNHYTYQHPHLNGNSHYPGGAIPEVDEVDTDEVYHTDHTRPSTGYYTRSSNNSSSGSSSQNHHEADTMVLNQYHHDGNKGGPPRGGQMHLNMSMGINNFVPKEGINIIHTNNTNSKADNTFTNNSKNNGLRGKGNSNLTMTHHPMMDTLGSTISSNSGTDSTILTIHTEMTTGSSLGLIGESGNKAARSPSERFSETTYLTGFDSSTTTSTTSGSGAGSSGPCKPNGHDIVNPRISNNADNGQGIYNNNQLTTNSTVYNHQVKWTKYFSFLIISLQI